MQLQRDQVTKHLKFLFASGDRSLVIQTFGEGAHKGDKHLARVLTPRALGVDKLLAGIEALQSRGAGVFVQVQAGRGRGNKHIEGVRCVFLDLDGTPISVVQDAVKAGFPKPAMVVESSRKAPGGPRYHVYWRVIGCELAQYSQVQKALAARFGGDGAVHDLSRVMRLPGTLNFKYDHDGEAVVVRHYKPDIAPVSVGELLEHCVQVSDHLPDQEISNKSLAALHNDIGTLGDSLVIGGYDQESVAEIKELKPGDRTQKIVRIAGAMVTDNPDESAATLKKMLVAEVERRTPDGIKGPTAESWHNEIFPAVDRFVERREAEKASVKAEREAIPEGDSPEYVEAFEAFHAARDVDGMTLAQFADRFVMVNATRQVIDLTKSPAQVPLSVAAFKDYSLIFRHEGKPLFGQWMKNKTLRRTVDKLMYKPFPYTLDKTKIDLQRIVRDQDTGELCYNTYAVPRLKPIASMDELTYKRYLKPFLEHIEYIMQTPAKTKVMLDWLAATVQRPDKRVTWAPLIVTRFEGVGKGWLSQVLKQLIGPTNHGFVTADEFDRQVQYNEFLADCTLLVIDEVYAPRRPDIKNRINALVTEPTMEINRKFGTKRRETIYCNTIAFSNHPDALDLKVSDRRFFVNIHRQPPKDAAYYNKLFNWLEEGVGPSVLMDWLLRRDLSAFNWGECPRVDGDKDKLTMQVENLSEVEEVLESLLEDSEGPFAGKITCKRMIEEYLVNNANMELTSQSHAELKRWLRKRGSSVGRLRRMPRDLRLQTFYCVDPMFNFERDAACVVAEAKKSLKGVYGENTLYLVSEED